VTGFGAAERQSHIFKQTGFFVVTVSATNVKGSEKATVKVWVQGECPIKPWSVLSNAPSHLAQDVFHNWRLRLTNCCLLSLYPCNCSAVPAVFISFFA
jgi:hypothetical protein